nr:hypothetical protein [Tanacetum cinerariifolium]
EDVSVAKRKVTKQLRLEWTNNEMGQSTGNAVDVSSVDDVEVVSKASEVEQTLERCSEEEGCSEHSVVDKGKQVVDDDENSKSSEHSKEEEDNDYIVGDVMMK